MKRVESIARTAMMMTLVVLALSGIFLTQEYIGWVAYHEGEGGNIYEIILDARVPAFLWTGIYGVTLRFPGFVADTQYDLENAGTLEANLLFDCLPTDRYNEVYASEYPSAQIDFPSLQPATAAEIDTYLGTAAYPSLYQFMAAVNTYTDLMSIDVGITTISNIPAVYTYDGSGNPPVVFDTGILKDSNGYFVYVSHIQENLSLGFDNRLRNYQMLLPIRNSSTDTSFYFFVDPNNFCPGGEGEQPSGGFVEGVVTSEIGVPLEYAIVDVAGYSAVTDATGYYNLTVPEGDYRIFATLPGYEVYVSNISILANGTTIHNIVMTPQVENYYTGIGPGEDDPGTKTDSGVGPGQDDGPGEAPLVPLIEQPKKIEGTDYIISLAAINRKLRVGNFLQEEIRIFSYRESTTEVFFELTGSIVDLIDMDKDKMLIAPISQDRLAMTIYGRGDPGIYNGTLEITGDFNASIPITIDLLPVEQLPVQALLMDIEVSNKVIHPGDEVRFKTDLKNLLTDQQFPVTLFFTVQDELGKETLWTYSTNVYLRTSFSLLKSFKLPKDLPEGIYIIRATASYLGFSSGTSESFQVVTPFWQLYFYGLFMWQWGAILAGLLLLILAVIVIRRRIESQKRFHLKVEYSQLPKPGPRSGWWGKIAETDHKTYFDLEQLKIHTIVAGSTGGGKSISAQSIVEECLIKDTAVIVFDPTAQWSGMLRPCKEKGMLKYYPGFNMKPKDARAFNGNVRLVTNAREVIELKRYMKPGEIQIFAMNKLPPKDIDIFVANTIRQVFAENFKEATQLKLLLVYDEIHRILPKFGGSGDGFVQIERGCREFRKWGVGVMLVSQVLADFVGQIKANINTEVQMRTRDEGDLERIKMKYGDDVLKSLVKASVGSGMVQNAAYNRGRPYFVTFRPIMHSVQRLTDEELEKYNKYNEQIDQMQYELDQLEELELDVFDMKLELKLSLDKVKTGNFNMVEVYLEGIIPRLKKEWEKLGKTPKRKEVVLVSEQELKDSLKAAQSSRAEAEANAPKTDAGDKKDEDLFKKDVAPDKILNLVNGMIVINIQGLYDEISAMKPSDFEQHVNNKKNDFAKWIHDAVGDKELAQHIGLTNDKQEILKFLDLKRDKKKMPAFTPDEKKKIETLKWFDSTSNAPTEEKKEEPKPPKEGEVAKSVEKKEESTETKLEEVKPEEKKEEAKPAEPPAKQPPADTATQEAAPAKAKPAELIQAEPAKPTPVQEETPDKPVEAQPVDAQPAPVQEVAPIEVKPTEPATAETEVKPEQPVVEVAPVEETETNVSEVQAEPKQAPEQDLDEEHREEYAEPEIMESEQATQKTQDEPLPEMFDSKETETSTSEVQSVIEQPSSEQVPAEQTEPVGSEIQAMPKQTAPVQEAAPVEEKPVEPTTPELAPAPAEPIPVTETPAQPAPAVELPPVEQPAPITEAAPIESAPVQATPAQPEQKAENLEEIISLNPDQYFRLSNGTEITSMLDLVESLRGMTDDDFKHYVTAEKNDFANWIRGAFHDGPLADKINPIKSREETIHVLQEG